MFSCIFVTVLDLESEEVLCGSDLLIRLLEGLDHTTQSALRPHWAKGWNQVRSR